MHIKTVGAYEAKTHLPALLDSVESGEKIVITRHGIPVAILMPYQEKSDSIDSTINALLEFRKGKHLGEVTIAELKNDGRKY